MTKVLMIVINQHNFGSQGSEATSAFVSLEQCNHYGAFPDIVENTLDDIKPPAFYKWAQKFDTDVDWQLNGNGNTYTRLMCKKNQLTLQATARLEVTFVWVDVEVYREP